MAASASGEEVHLFNEFPAKHGTYSFVWRVNREADVAEDTTKGKINRF